MLRSLIFLLFLFFFHSSIAEINPLQSQETADTPIKILKNYIEQYPSKNRDELWRRNFDYFLTTQIITSKDKAKITLAVCLLKPKFFDQCIGGPFSFQNNILGSRNILDILIANCEKDPSSLQRMLDGDIENLKFQLFP